jgi:hypothetical protein
VVDIVELEQICGDIVELEQICGGYSGTGVDLWWTQWNWSRLLTEFLIYFPC